MIAIIASCVLAISSAPANLLPNASFDRAVGEKPVAWSLAGGAGAYDAALGRGGTGCLTVSRGRSDASYWTCPVRGLKPGGLYAFSFHGRMVKPGSDGCVVSGPLGMNRDFQVGAEWTPCRFIFPVSPSHDGAITVRLGTWQKRATVAFDDAELLAASAFHRRCGKFVLGQGEQLKGNAYSFRAPLSSLLSAYSRPLCDFHCGFNSHRWTFGDGDWVVYRHEVGGEALRSATVEVQVGYYTGGTLELQARRSGADTWSTFAVFEGLVTKSVPLPGDLFPAESLDVRLLHKRAGKAGLQVYSYGFEAELARDTGLSKAGATNALVVEHATLDVAVRDVGALMPGGKNQVVATISGPADTRGTLQLDLKRRNGGRTSGGAVWFTDFILKGGPATVRLGYDVRSAGEGELLVSVVDSAGTDRYRARCSFSVPPLHAADFGWKVPSEGAGLNLWWCTATEKVGRERPAPRESKDVALEAAANEEEAFQLILRPDRDLENVRVRFTAPAGLPVTTRVREVAYVNVKIPTDYSGSTGPWPDPLPDHEKPVDCSAGTNQPFWLSVRVGPEAAAGNYTLQVLCEAAGREVARIPVKLRVFGFALPKAHSINTAFGFSAGVAARYHHVRSDADRRKLFDLYMQNFRDHRISTYSFAPYDPIKVSFSGYQWEGDGERVTENPATGAWCLRLADDSATRNIASTIASFIAIREGGVYTLSWKVRSAADAHPYLVTLDTYNRKKQWLSGHNIDLAREAGKTWRSEKARLVITDRSPDARFVKVVLRATAWFDDVSLREPAGPELIQDGGFEGGAGSADVSVDFEAWGRQGRRYLDEYAFDSFRLRLRGLGGGTFHSRRYGRIGPYRQGTEDYRMLLKRYASQVEAYLTAQGWLDKAFIYWFDEPQEKDYDFVKEGMREIRLAAPGLKRMLTEEPNDRLAGFVDIWCPVLHNAVPERISERIAAGETVWWYVCTGPKAPYLGLFTDHPATDLRVWLWLSWKYGVTGILVWQSNYWTSPCAYPKEDQDPWQDPMSYVSGYGRPAGFVGYWGNGDGRFIYPPRDRTGTVITGPVDSIRWEMLREGIEDYEYLALLKRLIVRAKAKGADISTFEGLLQVPGDIIRDGKTYTRSAAPIYRRRHQVAEAIELLRRR